MSMDLNTKDYFKEHKDNDVSGFTIIEESDDQVRLAEKWCRASGDTWTVYWVPKSRLLQRCREGACERVGQVTDEQFEAICENTDKRAIPA